MKRFTHGTAIFNLWVGSYKQFEEIIEMVKEKEMPIPSYTWMGLHPKAKISDAQREALISWAQSNMNTLSSTYPADSLVMKRN